MRTSRCGSPRWWIDVASAVSPIENSKLTNADLCSLNHVTRYAVSSAAIASRPGPAPEQLPEPIVIGCAPAAVGGAKMENAVKSFEPSIDHFIRIIGSGIEIFGVLVIVIGIVWSTYRQLRQPISEQDADVYKIRIGRSLLLGLEVLVAADIVKTIAHELSVMSLGLLAGLVLVRTFLSWTLVLEIEGRWPWQRGPSLMSSRARSGENREH